MVLPTTARTTMSSREDINAIVSSLSPDQRELLDSFDAAAWHRGLAAQLAVLGFRCEGQGKVIRCIHCNGRTIVQEDVGPQDLVVDHLREHPGCGKPVGLVARQTTQREHRELEETLNQYRPFFLNKGISSQLLEQAAGIAERRSTGAPAIAEVMHALRTLRKDTPAAETSPPTSVSRPQPREDLDVSDESPEHLCKICYQEPVGVAFVPCSHVVCCVQCASVLNTCAVCRANVTGYIRVALS